MPLYPFASPLFAEMAGNISAANLINTAQPGFLPCLIWYAHLFTVKEENTKSNFHSNSRHSTHWSIEQIPTTKENADQSYRFQHTISCSHFHFHFLARASTPVQASRLFYNLIASFLFLVSFLAETDVALFESRAFKDSAFNIRHSLLTTNLALLWTKTLRLPSHLIPPQHNNHGSRNQTLQLAGHPARCHSRWNQESLQVRSIIQSPPIHFQCHKLTSHRTLEKWP